MRWLALLALLPAPVLADCPPAQDQSAALERLGEAVSHAADPVEAQALMQELWLIWTKAPDARAQELLDRGMLRREAYDFAEARALFTELIDYCPDYAEGWNQRAFVHFLNADYGLALPDLERALELSPDHIAARAGLALTLMQLGRMEAGQSVLREALKMNPWLPERGMLLRSSEPEGEEL